MRKRRVVCSLMICGAVAVVVACGSAELKTSEPCRGDLCTCEQDPSQLRCRGFSPGDASFDAPPEDAPSLLPDADASGDADASSAADADADA